MTQSIIRSGLVGCAIVGTLVLAGCRGGDPASTPPDAAKLVAGSAAFDLLTQSGSYPSNHHTVAAAEELLVERCMAAKGLIYQPLTPPAVQSNDEQALQLEQRLTRGYGLFESYTTDPTDRSQSPSPVDRYVRQLSDEDRAAYMLALFGDERVRKGIQLDRSGEVTFPASGCVYESQTRIYGDVVTWARITYLPEDLNNALTERVVGTAEYIDGMHAWSTCMTGRGHHYPLPADAKDSIAARYAKEGPSELLHADEIAVAVADAECARQAGIPALVLTLKQRQIGILTADEQRSIVELAGAWLHAVDVAAGITKPG